MEYELYSEAHLTDVRRMAAVIDAHGWKNPVARPRYRVAIARALIALTNRVAHYHPNPQSSPL